MSRPYIMMTPATLAYRFVNLAEVPGNQHNPQILAMLQLVNGAVQDDETPWCSAFVNYIAWLLGCDRSHSLAARSWLKVGKAVDPVEAGIGFHVVVLQRGVGPQPGPSVIDAPGHVGFFYGYDRGGGVTVLGGNQGDKVSLATYSKSRILGIREI